MEGRRGAVGERPSCQPQQASVHTAGCTERAQQSAAAMQRMPCALGRPRRAAGIACLRATPNPVRLRAHLAPLTHRCSAAMRGRHESWSEHGVECRCRQVPHAAALTWQRHGPPQAPKCSPDHQKALTLRPSTMPQPKMWPRAPICGQIWAPRTWLGRARRTGASAADRRRPRHVSRQHITACSMHTRCVAVSHAEIRQHCTACTARLCCRLPC